MVNVTCCGGQDRNTTTSSTAPYRPPVETRNCYLNKGNGISTFDYMNCDTNNDIDNTACRGDGIPEGKGGCLSCKSSSGGGYCEIDGIYYSSKGMSRIFHKLTESDDIAELTKSSLGIGEMSRMFNRERQNMINRERQAEIRRTRRSSSSNTENTQEDSTEEETTITDYITKILLYIGLSATFIVMILSIVLIILK